MGEKPGGLCCGAAALLGGLGIVCIDWNGTCGGGCGSGPLYRGVTGAWVKIVAGGGPAGGGGGGAFPWAHQDVLGLLAFDGTPGGICVVAVHPGAVDGRGNVDG